MRMAHAVDRDVLRDLVQFRSVGGNLVPYVALDAGTMGDRMTGQLPIEGVIYGPTLDPKWAEHSLRLLLEKSNYPDAGVCPSTVPLRRA